MRHVAGKHHTGRARVLNVHPLRIPVSKRYIREINRPTAGRKGIAIGAVLSLRIARAGANRKRSAYRSPFIITIALGSGSLHIQRHRFIRANRKRIVLQINLVNITTLLYRKRAT